MKNLTKPAQKNQSKEQNVKLQSFVDKEESQLKQTEKAQCCAKRSRITVGCHD